jgi:hypothetical protein
MAFSSGEKWLFGLGGGLVLVAIAYGYVTAKKTVQAGAKELTSLGGFLPNPFELARTGGQAAGYIMDSAGNIVQSGSNAIGTWWDMWKGGVNIIGGAVGAGDIFPGDLPGYPEQGQGGTYWGSMDTDQQLPPNTPYTGPEAGAHDLDTYIMTGKMPGPMTTLYDIIIWTVGQNFRGGTWDSADWANIQTYTTSGLAAQDPYLYQNAQIAISNQQGRAANAGTYDNSDQWVSG